jgi:KDO2-lipid IV(A) lauroyltransferase
MYILSDGISFLLYRIIKYRRDVVKNNLLIAFPEKTEEERAKIAREFYKDFVDNFIEMIKMISISKKEMEKRFKADVEVLNNVYDTGKNVQIHTGHYFNWEYANLAYLSASRFPFVVAYKPISNKIFERITNNMRMRFGTHLVSSTNFRNDFKKFINNRFALALAGDQNPNDTNKAYWTDFFGKKTPFARGPEKGAVLNNAAVIMMDFYKVKRGYYESKMYLLTLEPRSLPDGEITRQMIAFIEETIRKHPSNYLWSHRRWKWEFKPEQHAHLVVE